MIHTVNLLEPTVLLLLHERPGHGYDLIQRLRELDLDFAEAPGTVYRCLKSLEKRGLISHERAISDAGPSRKIYRTTAAGGLALDDWMGRLSEVRELLSTCIDRSAGHLTAVCSPCRAA